MKVKETRGGKREGSGRPKLAPTKTLSYRVPLKLAAKIDKEIRKIISNMKALIFLFLMCCISSLCSCTKPEQTEGQCLIISLKYTTQKVYFKTDTLYNDYLTGHWFQVFVENKKIWDLDTGFVVCDLNIFEKRIYIIK